MSVITKHAGGVWTALLMIILIAAVGAANAQEGEWIDLEPLRTDGKAEADVKAAPEPDVDSDPAPPMEFVEYPDPEPDGASVVVSESVAVADPVPTETDTDTDMDTEESVAAGNPPPLNLPHRFRWQGREAPLGRVGYVYLGDYYLVEERDFEKAEVCYRYALEPWPDCGPIQTRLELLSLFTGDWVRAAESMQVGFDDGVPPLVAGEYGIEESSPILSNRRDEVPPVPAINFRLALAHARQIDVEPDFEPARSFLAGRLLAHLGEYDTAIGALSEVALDETAEPWNFQAAGQRAALYLERWQPELAYVNLLRAKELVGEHPVLMDRLATLRDEMTLQVADGPGDAASAVVRILARQDQGRWIISAPDLAFEGHVRVAGVAGESAATSPHLLYRGRDYWVMVLPLGSPEPDWSEGTRVTLRGS